MFVVTLNNAAAGVVVIAAALVALIGSEWAPAVNTGLIIILAMYQAYERGKVHRAERIAREAKRQARDAKYAAGANKRDLPGHPDTGQRRRWTDSPEAE